MLKHFGVQSTHNSKHSFLSPNCSRTKIQTFIIIDVNVKEIFRIFIF
jgi:hypothetical protein